MSVSSLTPAAKMGEATFTVTLISPPPIRTLAQSNLPITILSRLQFSAFSLSRPEFPGPVKTTFTTTAAAAAARASITNRSIPARDRVIDFGKYRGRMLGSLPSSYLRWISKNLRAGDTLEWARWADQVLADPVYGDRIEWEAAEQVLNGNVARRHSDGGAVAELLELCERFGWDREDRAGWARVDFGLLGTSKGGRIPRAGGGGVVPARSEEERESGAVRLGDGGGGKRRERRERARVRRVEKTVGGGMGGGGDGLRSFEDGEGGSNSVSGEGGSGSVGGGGVEKRFPGREALLRKVLTRGRGFN
ncbi:hypothetical protein STAS_31203 [Striga asiatica]|uniref:Uncharacterized protein n=1 Tax=Striga asiatica TaxID=4170 RepID=A0A5A7R8N7_STRAF|nr:hypothetical protein STAS_31203 [Striga asiatica]